METLQREARFWVIRDPQLVSHCIFIIILRIECKKKLFQKQMLVCLSALTGIDGSSVQLQLHGQEPVPAQEMLGLGDAPIELCWEQRMS